MFINICLLECLLICKEIFSILKIRVLLVSILEIKPIIKFFSLLRDFVFVLY